MNASTQPAVIVVGAGPAGLTAAAELAERGLQVRVLERDPHYVGGIARTVEYKGYRFDIGGHRFFSKNPEIGAWWKRRLGGEFISVRRASRIYYNHTFFDYPLKAGNALRGLGPITTTACLVSYLWAQLRPIRPERSFADWVSNRFGRKLFSIFFRTYTEKVWGMSCDEISADWAAQRIKGLSLWSAILSAILPKRSGAVIKTLVDSFDYPRLGPGQMWEKTRDDIVARGGEVQMDETVVAIHTEKGRVSAMSSRNAEGLVRRHEASQFIVSLPLREAVQIFDPPLPEHVRAAAEQLRYRDFLTVALMVSRTGLFPDNWIYVHDPDVKLGRIQNFNNWSPYMVPDPNTTCLGLEYFCNKGDDLWRLSDVELIELGKAELVQLGIAKRAEIFDGTVVRMEKAYPVYDATYSEHVAVIRKALAAFPNIQPVGRNGMHKYNNQDHSMMTAILAARNIQGASYDTWKVNTDAEYHEEAREDGPKTGRLVPRRLDPQRG